MHPTPTPIGSLMAIVYTPPRRWYIRVKWSGRKGASSSPADGRSRPAKRSANSRSVWVKGMPEARQSRGRGPQFLAGDLGGLDRAKPPRWVTRLETSAASSRSDWTATLAGVSPPAADFVGLEGVSGH